jgi:hypothetical protein
MAFHLREYDVRFWIGKPSGDPPWHASRWSHLRPAFDSLVECGRKPLKLRTSQIDSTGKHVRFGKMSWSSESDSRWLHQTSDPRYFENLELWAPNPTICLQEDRAPDVYFDITNLQGAGGYQWFIVAAIAVETPETTRSAVLSRISSVIREQFPGHVSAAARRPWGYPEGAVGFTDGMQELSHTLEFKVRNGTLNLAELRGKWSSAPAR